LHAFHQTLHNETASPKRTAVCQTQDRLFTGGKQKKKSNSAQGQILSLLPLFSPAVKALRSTSAQPSRVTTSLNLDTNHSPRTTPQRTTPQRTTTHYAIPQQRAQSNKKKLENKASGLPPFAQPNLLPRPPDI